MLLKNGQITDNLFPSMHGRTQHIDTRFHFICGLMSNGTIDIQYCNTHGEQLANVFTKALPNHIYAYFREALGVKKF